jgi:hypothetical protein
MDLVGQFNPTGLSLHRSLLPRKDLPVNPDAQNDGIMDRKRLVALMQQLHDLGVGGAGTAGSLDHVKRDQVLDEIQDIVGLSGKMVMDRDIIKRATQLLAEGSGGR